MDPVTAGLWVGASLFMSLSSNKSQARIESASVKMEQEQARLQIAEQAYERTKAFKQSISANLALSGMGKGGLSGFRGVASESLSSYLQDSQALTMQDAFARLGGNVRKASNKANSFARNISSLESAASLAAKLGLFTGGK